MPDFFDDVSLFQILRPPRVVGVEPNPEQMLEIALPNLGYGLEMVESNDGNLNGLISNIPTEEKCFLIRSVLKKTTSYE